MGTSQICAHHVKAAQGCTVAKEVCERGDGPASRAFIKWFHRNLPTNLPPQTKKCKNIFWRDIMATRTLCFSIVTCIYLRGRWHIRLLCRRLRGLLLHEGGQMPPGIGAKSLPVV